MTDHDTLAGYREVVAADAVPADMDLIPGVEINAIVTRDLGLWEGELHILGLRDGSGRRRVRGDARRPARAGGANGSSGRSPSCASSTCRSTITSSTSRQAGDDALGRPTVARALIAAGHAASVEDAFGRLLGWGKPGYVPRTGLGPVEAIEAIRAAGGLPVLAHFGEAPARVEVVRELVDAGLGGLEVYYRSFDSATVFAVGEVAAALGLVATGGSDYHGDTSTYAEAHAGLWVPPEVAAGLAVAGVRGVGVVGSPAQP